MNSERTTTQYCGKLGIPFEEPEASGLRNCTKANPVLKEVLSDASYAYPHWQLGANLRQIASFA